jgi:cysteine-rich repeat protein
MIRPRRYRPTLSVALIAIGFWHGIFGVGPRFVFAAPDLVPEISDVGVFVSDVDPGDVEEGCAGGQLARRLVRFTLRTRNLGPDDLSLGDPGCPDCHENPGAACTNPLFSCSTAHGHAHFNSFVRPELLDANGTVVAQGYKFGFCLLDSDCAQPQFDCTFQGISAGCSDVYISGLPCQYVDITGDDLAPGVYTLRVTIDPLNQIAEADETNNVVEAPVQIGAAARTCPVEVSSDVPRNIPDLGSTTSTLQVPLAGPIKRVSVVGLRGTHPFINDLEIHLVSPSGTDVVVMNRVCGSDDDFHLDLSDGACRPILCPPTDGQAHRPSAPLAAFNGEEAAGTWTLRAFDRAGGEAGTLQGWGLEVCVPGVGCPVYTSTDGPVAIPDQGVAISTLTAPAGKITDLNVVGLDGTHTFIQDLEVHLISPSGTDVTVMDRICHGDPNFSLDLDDESCSLPPCPPTDGLPHQPSNPLSVLDGEDAAGTWTLEIFDRAAGDAGTLNGWGIQVCSCGNGILDPGEECDDGNSTSGDCCSATCQAEIVCPACEACDIDTVSCVARPRPLCRVPVEHGKASLVIHDKTSNARDALTWRWLRGEATSPSEFGNPVSADDYTLCLYDASQVKPALVFRAAAPAGGTCGSHPCWQALGKPPGSSGFRYSDFDRTPDGLQTILLEPGAAANASIVVKGRGDRLVLPSLPLNLPLKMQLHGPAGACWQAEYEANGARKNDPTQFKAKAE